MTRAIPATITTLLVACATTPVQSPDDLGAPPVGLGDEQPVPRDLLEQVHAAERVGRLLYTLDKASALGTDAARDNVPDGETAGVSGWLTFQEGDGSGRPGDAFHVLFLTNDEPPKIPFEVRIPARGDPAVEQHRPPPAAPPPLARLFRARQLAIRHLPSTDESINPVVLPGELLGRTGILVYLLAATVRPGEMVFGIHHRALVSADGTQLLEMTPLSKSAIVLREPDGPASAQAVPFVSHLVSDTPLETHVFVSLLHHRPVAVSTARGMWLVNGDRISYRGP